MLSAIQLKLRDVTYSLGLVLLAISLAVFSIPMFSSASGDTGFMFFMFNFAFTVLYFIFLWSRGNFKRASGNLHTIFIFLLLFLVSAYSLNREMNVFDDSTNWMCVMLVISGINYLLFPFLGFVPGWLKHIMSAILGVSILIFVYLAIYLLPVYPFGFICSPVLGVSLHAFVPILILVYSVVLLRKTFARHPQLIKSFVAGVAIVVGVVVFFIISWNSLTKTVNHDYRKEAIEGDENLPAWVKVSQKIPKNWLTEKLLKTGLVYSLPAEQFSWNVPKMNFDERRKHDPLVLISSLFANRTQLSDDEKISVLKSMYDSRHEAEERLWTGEDLKTTHVNTTVQLWPTYRIAYTEKVISVENTNAQSWRGQEAIYTFHLPEGGVVTSLSLWIGGKEAKGVLTTKEKAKTAYQTVVGVESRDPSLVQWQEGNRVSVRVFPVAASETRMFKIGVTAPLTYRDNRLEYDNIYFDGPLANAAEEDAKIVCNGAENLDVPDNFTTVNGRAYIKSGTYDAGWKLSCNSVSLSPGTFNFSGFSYAVGLYKPEAVPVDFGNVYLDINASWSEDELFNIYKLVKKQKVFVYDDGLQQVDNKNYESLFADLRKKRFTLFPFYLIHHPEQSLVITKCEGPSPTFDDLSGSELYNRLQAAHQPQVRLFNIGYELSPYLKSLRELRRFQYQAGSFRDLTATINESVFEASGENDEQVVVHDAGIVLTRKAAIADTVSKAPDHLMRLFAYNHIMKQIGDGTLTDTTNEKQITEAKQAYVVSPVSSLVVLESVQDYERFDIKAAENSLQNASAKSNGAVPEPHEWALIIVALLILVYAKYPFLFKKLTTR